MSAPNEGIRIEHEEFLRLFLTHQPAIRAFIRSVIWDRFQCEDVMQDVALTLWKQIDRYDPARPFGAWARGVAGNHILKTIAATRRGPLAFSPDAIAAIIDAHNRVDCDPTQEREALRLCLERLPPRSRELIALRYEEALKLGEIAERLSSTLDAVHKALSRIRQALHHCIQQRLASDEGAIG